MGDIGVKVLRLILLVVYCFSEAESMLVVGDSCQLLFSTFPAECLHKGPDSSS